MSIPHQLLALGGLVADLALFQLFANLHATLDVRSTSVSLWWDVLLNSTHSMSSNTFRKLSGRSLNLVDLVNGAPDCDCDCCG